MIALWVSYGVSVVLAVADRLLGNHSPEAFLGTLALYVVLTVIPYKISQGRNWARYLFAVLTVFGVAVIAAGDTESVTKLELLWSWACVPLDAWIAYSLFSRESNVWFAENR